MVEFPFTSLYLNSLLANLNAREYIRVAASDVEYNSYQLGDSSRTAVSRNGSERIGQVRAFASNLKGPEY